MTEKSLITDGLRKLIGTSFDPIVFKVEEGAIQRYAIAIGDPDPAFNDVCYAKKSKYGRLICPPGFFGWPVVSDAYDPLQIPVMLITAGAPMNVLDGGAEYEFFEPIGAGDILTSNVKIIDITEKSAKSGPMLITTLEATLINQDGIVVTKARLSTINH